MGKEELQDFEDQDIPDGFHSSGRGHSQHSDDDYLEDEDEPGDDSGHAKEERHLSAQGDIILPEGEPLALQTPDDSDKDRPLEEGWFEHYKLSVDAGQRPVRIDVFLSAAIRNQSRTRIKNAAQAGCIRVNRKEVKASYKVKPGDHISFYLPHPPAPEATPEDIPLDISYEDDSILMINKAPGMVVHPGIGNWNGTMVHALLFHLNRKKLDRPKEEWDKPYLVHRIDKDTSGLLVVAKNEFAHASLSAQFFRRVTERIYYALVWGDVEADQGRVEGHVGRSPYDRKQFAVYPDGSNGKYAITNYEVLERFTFATLVKCKLETGRTHQIRVHMKYLGHPLVGDSFYDGDVPTEFLATPKYDLFIQQCLEIMPRQALHAKTLGFRHPISELRSYFEVGLPEDFKKALQKMREYRDTYLR